MPGPFPFKQILAADPSNPAMSARNGEVLLFAPGDATMTPLVIWDLSHTIQLPNPVTVNDLGFGPAFIHDTLDQVAWSGGGLSGTFESYRGMKDVATAAEASSEASATSSAQSAQSALDAADNAATAAAAGVQAQLAATAQEATDAKAAAQQAAQLVNAPADTVTAALVGNPATATGAALSAAIGDSLPSAAYPARKLAAKLNDRALLGTAQQARVLAFGDSIALFKWHTLYPLLNRAFGGSASAGCSIGSGLNGTGWALPGVTNNGTTGTVTLQTAAFDIWPSGYADLYATGATKLYGTGGVSATWDRLKIYYAMESAAGTFKVQIDGVDEPGFESVSAAGTGLGIITITRGTVAARTVKVVNLTGTHRIIGAGFERSDRAGVIFGNVSQGGIALDQQTSQGYANFQAYLTDFNPDIITFEMKENSSYLPAKMDEFLGYVEAGAPTATFVGIGSTPTLTNDADQVVQNAQLRAACLNWGKVYWDGYAPFGSYAAMDELGWAGDGIHVNEKASSFLAGLMARDLGLFAHAGADNPANVNAKQVTALERIALGTLGKIDVTGSADIVISGSTVGAGYLVFTDSTGAVKARFPIGGAAANAILPNTAQIGEGNARLTADANGINVNNPAGSAKALMGASKFTADALGGFRWIKVTTAARPNGAALGDVTMIFDDTLKKFIYWEGGAWRDLTGTAV